jgi:hypothetical protein
MALVSGAGVDPTSYDFFRHIGIADCRKSKSKV